MFRKQLDILTVGDITTDAFIRLKDAHIHCRIDHEEKELCLPFGEKIPFEYVKIVRAVGNAANAAVATRRLGLNSAIMANIGNDQNGKDCLAELQRNGIVTSNIIVHANKPTNYHFVLWYETDRTILVNHTDYDYRLPVDFEKNRVAPPKWLYLTSLAANTFPYHMQIADYIDANPNIKLAFQPGTYQIKLGHKELERIYKRADLFIVNLEEARQLINSPGNHSNNSLGDIPRNYLEQLPKRDSAIPVQSEMPIKILLKSLADLGPKLVVITDDIKGAYLFDGDNYYHMPIYPDARPPLERTGCGDAWAATFIGALVMNKTPLEALMWAPINPMSVAQFIGSQEGLLSFDQIQWWLKRAPGDYKPREI